MTDVLLTGGGGGGVQEEAQKERERGVGVSQWKTEQPFQFREEGDGAECDS